MTKLARANFMLLDTKDNGQVLIIDALPYVDPKTKLQKEENKRKAKQIWTEILAQQRVTKTVMDWIESTKDRKDIPTEDYLFIRKVGELLAKNE